MNGGDQRLILFTAAGQWYALPASAVSEILPIARLSRPAGLRDSVEGLLALDGRTIPVFDLARLLGLGATPVGLYTPLVILQGTSPAALMVERVREMAVVSSSALMPITEGGAAVAEFHHGAHPVHVLDVAEVVGS